MDYGYLNAIRLLGTFGERQIIAQMIARRLLVSPLIYKDFCGCHLLKHGHDRLCWLIQKRVEKRFYIRRVEVRGTKYIPLEKLTSIALEIGRRDLTNSVTTSFTLVGNSADSRRLAQCRETVYGSA
jgi:hypothetical protein